MRFPKTFIAYLLTLAVLSTGCGLTSLTQTLGQSTGSFSFKEPTLEIYSRVAGGALRCWFGPAGGLKKTHVFHADAVPPSQGGTAEIVLHERDGDAPSPRSLRAYRMKIEPGGNGSIVTLENLRLAEPLALEMAGDVGRWGGGDEACGEPLLARGPAVNEPATTGQLPAPAAAAK